MSDYDDFAKRMGSFDMELSLEDIGTDTAEEEDDELAHHGVQGMKWGVRRYQPYAVVKGKMQKARTKENTLQDKLKNIKAVGDSKKSTDAKRFAYREKSLTNRLIGAATASIMQQVIMDVVTSNTNYKEMPKKDLTKRLLLVGKNTAVTVGTNTALANRAAKNYGNDGRLLEGKVRKGKTTEDRIQSAPVMLKRVSAAINVGKAIHSITTENAKIQRKHNEQMFKDSLFAGRILDNKVGDVVWKSNDGSSVLSNPWKK